MPSEPPVASPTAGDREQGPSLQEIADAIDPGPRAALTVDVPQWLWGGLGLPARPPNPEAALVQAQEQWRAWEARIEGGGDTASLEGLLELALALALAERAAGTVDDAPTEALLLLERLYRIIDVPALANDHNLFAQMLRGFSAVIAQQGDVQTSAVFDELGARVFDGLERAGDLHRRTVAVLLRRAPGHADVPEVLARTATTMFPRDPELAIGMVRRSLALRGDAATGKDWLDLAALCHRALDLRCGARALARAEALASETELPADHLEGAHSLAKAAHRAVDLRGAPGLEDSLSRAKALVELQRYDEAKEIFEHLHKLHPDDARPIGGLANAVLVDTLDFAAAFEILERAQPRDHLDQDWYELAIGVRATALVYHILPQLAGNDPDAVFEVLRPMLAQMRRDIDGLEALGAEEGRVLRFLHELGMQVWPHVRSDDGGALLGMARGLLARTVELRREVPGSIHAYTLMLAAAEFADDRTRALAVLDVEPPAEHAEALVVRRAQAAFDLVAEWNASDRVDTLLRLADAADGPTRPLAARRLVVDAHALAYRLGHRGDELSALERRYQALREQPGGSADAVLLNNLAVVIAAQGRADEAQVLWAEAIEQAEEDARDVPRLNAIAMRLVESSAAPGPGLSTAQRDELQALAEAGGAIEIRLLARAWQVVAAKGPELRAARKALRAAAEREAAVNYRPHNLPGPGGVIVRGSVQMGLGYSSVEGMQLQLDIVGVPWLVVPCPVAIPDPRAKQ